MNYEKLIRLKLRRKYLTIIFSPDSHFLSSSSSLSNPSHCVFAITTAGSSSLTHLLVCSSPHLNQISSFTSLSSRLIRLSACLCRGWFRLRRHLLHHHYQFLLSHSIGEISATVAFFL